MVGKISFYAKTIMGLSDDVRVSKRLSIPSSKLRGFERGKVGPVDNNDFIGGNHVTTLNLSATLPNIVEGLDNLDVGVFIDAANVWGVDYNSSLDDNSTSADIVDQASSYTEKNVEMRAINRQIKLISKIDSALKKIQDGTYGFCEDTGEPIGLKRLMARPVATLCIAAQEKHEKEEKVYADD